MRFAENCFDRHKMEKKTNRERTVMRAYVWRLPLTRQMHTKTQQVAKRFVNSKS